MRSIKEIAGLRPGQGQLGPSCTVLRCQVLFTRPNGHRLGREDWFRIDHVKSLAHLHSTLPGRTMHNVQGPYRWAPMDYGLILWAIVLFRQLHPQLARGMRHENPRNPPTPFAHIKQGHDTSPVPFPGPAWRLRHTQIPPLATKMSLAQYFFQPSPGRVRRNGSHDTNNGLQFICCYGSLPGRSR